MTYFAMAYGGAAAIQKGIGFFFFLWMARVLPVREYAEFGLLYSVQTGLCAFAAAGIVEAVIGLLSEHNNPSSRARLFDASNTVFGLFSVVAISVLVAGFALFHRNGGVSTGSLVAVVVSGILTAFFTLQASLVRLNEEHKASLVLGFVAPIAGFAGAAAGFVYSHSVGAFCTGFALGLVIALIVLGLTRVGSYRFAGQSKDVAPILSGIMPYLLVVVLGWLGGYGNTYLVSWSFNAEAVARFTFLYTLASILELVATAMNQVWNPRFFRLIHDQPVEAVDKTSRSFFGIQGGVIGLAGAGLLLVLSAGFKFWGGNLAAYHGNGLELLLLFCAYAVSIPRWHAQNYFYAHKRGRELMNATVVGSLLGLFSAMIAMAMLGPIGVYLGFFLQMITRTACMVIWAKKRWSISLVWEGSVLALLLLLSGGVVSVMMN